MNDLGSTLKLKMKLRGVNQAMTTSAAYDVVRREAQQMAESAGGGFEAVVVPHRWTARAYVRTANTAGRMRQANGHVLERVITERAR